MILSKDIKDLHPTLQRGAQELIKRMAALGYPVGISATYRDNEYQNTLYAQGRTKPGSIVTNAQGGESIHNYRLAFDIFKNIAGQAFTDMAFFDTAGKLWQDMGGEWGGAWKGFADRPHMQFTNGLSLTQLQKGAVMPDVPMPWEREQAKVTPPPANSAGSEKSADGLIKTLNVLYNGGTISVQAILMNDTNYVKLRDLEKFGFTIGYDDNKKMPILTI